MVLDFVHVVAGVGAAFTPLSFRELTRKAVHLYGPPIQASNRPVPRQFRLFPCMNFTCSGQIEKLWFVSQYGSDYQSGCPPVEFRLMRKYHGPEYCSDEYPNGTDCEYNQLLKLNHGVQEPHIVHTNGGFGVYEVTLSTNNSFRSGDILGVRHSLCSNTSDTLSVTVMYQNGGEYCNTLQKGSMLNLSISSSLQVLYTHLRPVLPYIAIETEPDVSGQHCAMGFLKKKSLYLIVDAPRNRNNISSLFDFTRVDNVQSVPINEPGLLTLFIAARFSIMVTSGWPVLQIKRRNSSKSNSYNLVREFGTMMEPKPTGYLNVYEYDLQNITFEVQRDDVISVHWPQDTNPFMKRYSLAYFKETSNVMLAIEVQQSNSMCKTDSEATSASISGLNTRVASETSKSEKWDNVIAVVCATIIFIISMVTLTVLVVLMYMCRQRHQSKLSEHSTMALNKIQHSDIDVDLDLKSNQAYIPVLAQSEVKDSTILKNDCTEMQANAVYTMHFEAKKERQDGTLTILENIEVNTNAAYGRSTLPKQQVNDYEDVTML